MSSSTNAPANAAEREQALRDYKLTIEYKHLKQHAPGGVFLLPSLHDLRLFHGFILVRRGAYAGGLFKFKIRVPRLYNDVNAWPKITFVSRVYNPYVEEETGVLNVKGAYPRWDPHKHYLVTILTHLKKIFYVKEFGKLGKTTTSASSSTTSSEASSSSEVEDAVVNPEALHLYRTNPTLYRRKVDACVAESKRNIYLNEVGSTATLLEDDARYRTFRNVLMRGSNNNTGSAGAGGGGGGVKGGGVSEVPTSVSRTRVLEIISKTERKFNGPKK